MNLTEQNLGEFGGSGAGENYSPVGKSLFNPSHGGLSPDKGGARGRALTTAMNNSPVKFGKRGFGGFRKQFKANMKNELGQEIGLGFEDFQKYKSMCMDPKENLKETHYFYDVPVPEQTIREKQQGPLNYKKIVLEMVQQSNPQRSEKQT